MWAIVCLDTAVRQLPLPCAALSPVATRRRSTLLKGRYVMITCTHTADRFGPKHCERRPHVPASGCAVVTDGDCQGST